MYKNNKESNMFKYLFIPILFLLAGCATSSPEITESNNHIRTPKYSIKVPANRGWKKNENMSSSDITYLEKKVGSNSYIMRFSTNYVVDNKIKSWSAEKVAIHYRKGEEQNMRIMGAGMYKLKDVVMGKKKVGNKQFYIMDYTTTKEGFEQKASLYLYFPKKTNFGSFLVALYSEAYKPSLQSFKSEFLDTLNNLEMK